MKKFFSKKEYQLIANVYNLGQIKTLKYFKQGYGKSGKAKVSTRKGEFVISRDVLSNKKDLISKSKESLQYEIDMLNSIENMCIPKYVLSVKNNFIEKFKNNWVSVYYFLPGETPKSINSYKARQLGEFLGEFHTKSKKFNKILLSRRKFYDLNSRVLGKMRKLANCQNNKTLKLVVQEVERGVIKNYPFNKLPKGPIHVDIGHGNELFIGDKLSGIIDFGNFYHGPFMVDVGKTIMWNCCENKKLNQKLVASFLKGYENKRKLSRLEKKYIKKSILFAIYSHIWVDLYHVPIKYVPESYTLFLVKNFLPVAIDLENSKELFSS
jgi:homoserine kinase type II